VCRPRWLRCCVVRIHGGNKDKKQMEKIRIEYKSTVDAITLLGGADRIAEHLRADIGNEGSTERDHVELLCETACRYVSEITGRNFYRKTATVYLPYLMDRIELPFILDAITSVSYTNDNHTTTSVSDFADAFEIWKGGAPSVLEVRTDYATPTDVALDSPFPWSIVCGVKADNDVMHDNSTQVSRLLIAAALMYAAHLYENREAAGFTTGRPYVMPLAFESIVKTLKRIR
jgi:hypothetical protein